MKKTIKDVRYMLVWENQTMAEVIENSPFCYESEKKAKEDAKLIAEDNPGDNSYRVVRVTFEVEEQTTPAVRKSADGKFVWGWNS